MIRIRSSISFAFFVVGRMNGGVVGFGANRRNRKKVTQNKIAIKNGYRAFSDQVRGLEPSPGDPCTSISWMLGVAFFGRYEYVFPVDASNFALTRATAGGSSGSSEDGDSALETLSTITGPERTRIPNVD
jgi:hypothetical protein